MKKLFIFLIFSSILLMVSVAPSLAYDLSGTMEVHENLVQKYVSVQGYSVAVGKYIEVTVTVKNTGKISIKPMILISILPPNSKTPKSIWFKNLGTIDPGKEKSYSLKTGIKVNNTGTWTLTAALYDSRVINGKYPLLDSKTVTFTVEGPREV